MNAHTSKLLRKYSTATGRNYRAVKRAWNRIPAPQRHAFREEAAQAILDVDPRAD